MYCITKWCKSITDSGVDEYTHREKKMKDKLKELYGEVPALHKFRLLDDDGTVYAYGLSTDDSSFSPLDKYEPMYGCVSIEYKNERGEYEEL